MYFTGRENKESQLYSETENDNKDSTGEEEESLELKVRMLSGA